MAARTWQISPRVLKFFQLEKFRTSKRPGNFHFIIAYYIKSPQYINIPITTFVTIFPTILRRFPKILQLCPKDTRTFSEHFPDIFGDHRRLLKTSEGDLNMYRSCTNSFRVKNDIKNVVTHVWIKMISSWGRISIFIDSLSLGIPLKFCIIKSSNLVVSTLYRSWILVNVWITDEQKQTIYPMF